MKEEFIKFLKSKRLFSEFCRERKACVLEGSYMFSSYAKMSLDEYLSNVSPIAYVGCAFEWNPTKRGWHFWKEISNEWHEIVNEHGQDIH